MENKVYNKENYKWIRPWNVEKFDDIYHRDERFFSIVLKGVLSWFNRNIILYNKNINHFIFNTGSSYMYIESDGYEYSWNETFGEDQMYMKLPRCVVTLAGINIVHEELTQRNIRGDYERRYNNEIRAFNAEMTRIPLEIDLNFTYVLSNFNETIILLQELIDKLFNQAYFNVTYLGQVLRCSLQIPESFNPEINKIDMSSPETNQKTISLDVKVNTNYPRINTDTEILSTQLISKFGNSINLYNRDDVRKAIKENYTDKEFYKNG